LPDGLPDPEFFQNDVRYRDASILLAGRNFGCGSAREGAVRALAGIGIRCIIASSVADLFAANCFQNGLLVFTLDQAIIEGLAAGVAADPGGRPLMVDLERCRTGFADGEPVPFTVAARQREALLDGLDEIDLTFKQRAKIQDYRTRDCELRPWIYAT
jgi:3-isopropylmalate/(R)-2-methylmalate dehydratase small subunit